MILMEREQTDPVGWCAGRVYCLVCEAVAMAIWPFGVDERRLECSECHALDSIVTTRILTKEATRNLLRALNDTK